MNIFGEKETLIEIMRSFKNQKNYYHKKKYTHKSDFKI